MKLGNTGIELLQQDRVCCFRVAQGCHLGRIEAGEKMILPESAASKGSPTSFCAEAKISA